MVALRLLSSRCLSRASGALPTLLGKSWRRSQPAPFAWSSAHVRFLRSAAPDVPPAEGAASVSEFSKSWDEYKRFFHFPPASSGDEFQVGKLVTVHGFLGKRRDRSSKLTFVDLSVDDGPRIQVRSEWEERGSPEHVAHQSLRSAPAWSSISVTAKVTSLRHDGSHGRDDPSSSLAARFPAGVCEINLDLVSAQVLNPWPKDIIVSEGVQFPPAARHLQLRFSRSLRDRLRFREHLKSVAEECLRAEHLSEIETPMLFKSTPEGAREFLVPTRRPGMAYALPQSPQQYKQTLMAAGLGGYFQFARCFRDEDLRADRQPEFTQLDLEKSFATGEDVMALVERLMQCLYQSISSTFVQSMSTGSGWRPVRRSRQPPASDSASAQDYPDLPRQPFLRISYHDAMSLYGSDKPDLRIPGKIERVEHVLPVGFLAKISSLEDPIVDCWRCSFKGRTASECRQFVSDLMPSLPASLARNPDGEPVFLIHDPSKPLNGFSSLGFDAASTVAEGLEEGDMLVMQARQNRPFAGGSTSLGTLRTATYNSAVAGGFMPFDSSFRFLWVTRFPLFSPSNDAEPGQGGAAGFSSTHHPFTAPLTSEDFELLATDPLRAKADHYDLVLNGTELGGGSRRIHVAQVQEFVMRNILKMTDEGVSQFRHLLEALRAGCPPHAGFALGFDRLAAILSGTGSVRDVIAFPKTMKGEDLFARSPSPLTGSQLETYHLALRGPPSQE